MPMDKYEGPAEIYLAVSGRMPSSGLKLLAEASRLQVTVNSNDRPVRTMLKGLAGRSLGPREVEATIESAIPTAGMEIDYIKAVLEGADVLIIHKLGTTRRSYEGWLDTADTDQSTDNPAGLTARFMGKLRGEAAA